MRRAISWQLLLGVYSAGFYLRTISCPVCSSIAVVDDDRSGNRSLTAPKAASGSKPNDDKGAGIAVNTATTSPFPIAGLLSSLNNFLWITTAMIPRRTPIGRDSTQPTPPVATSSPNSIQSTTNNKIAVSGCNPNVLAKYFILVIIN